MIITIPTEHDVARLINAFGTIDFDVDEDFQNYNHVGILDVFDRCLNEEEAAKFLGYHHNKKHEPKFIEFFRSVFDREKDPLFVSLRLHLHIRFNVKKIPQIVKISV